MTVALCRCTMMMLLTAACLLVIIGGKVTNGLRAEPSSFVEGEQIPLNKMTSDFHWPVDYYQLPFCGTFDEEFDNNTWNLKELWTGDRIQPSPHRLYMKEDLYCQQLCVTNLGWAERKGRSPNKVVQFIRQKYSNNWIVDNLKPATKLEDEKMVTTRDAGGFPIGFVNVKDGKAYIYNHFNLELEYAPVETQGNNNNNKFRIVKFTVQPFSIKHDFDEADITDDGLEKGETKPKPVKVVEIKNPISSCKPNATLQHTNFDMVIRQEPQPASGKTLFTYDVIWKENREANWATQWKVYLSTDADDMGTKFLWLSIASNLFTFLVLTSVIIAILVRRWRRDVARYQCLTKTDEETQDEHISSSMDYKALLDDE